MTNKNKLNFGTVFFISITGSVMPLIRELFRVGWDFTAVENHLYSLFALGLTSFFLAFQIVEKMQITKKYDSYYLSILGVHFMITTVLMLLVVIGYAVLS